MTTAEEYFERCYGNKLDTNQSWVLRFAEAYAAQRVFEESEYPDIIDW